LGVQMKRDRGGFWTENSYGIRYSPPFHHGKPEAGLWFRTRGCGHDRIGGCVMCDYGAGPDTTSIEEMINSVKIGLNILPDHLYHLLVSPLGSFLDEWEVPNSARIGILHLMNETKHDTFSFESRAETITGEAISQCSSLLSNRPLKVYMGLESANPWVSKYCVNKALSLEVFEQAIQILTQQNVSTIANVILGTPFLSPFEQIFDAVESIRWAFSTGASECCLFPTHVKKWTSLMWLYQMGLYSSPSLWSFIEVLKILGPDICQNIELSWYSSQKYQDPNLVLSPTTCERCYKTVIGYLDEFDETANFQAIEKLIDLQCSCKDEWKKQLLDTPSSTILSRTTDAYEMIGKQFFNSWWEANRNRILTALSVEGTEFPWISQHGLPRFV
jgi:radical SAM enzyme (TIGR01210 family)